MKIFLNQPFLATSTLLVIVGLSSCSDADFSGKSSKNRDTSQANQGDTTAKAQTAASTPNDSNAVSNDSNAVLTTATEDDLALNSCIDQWQGEDLPFTDEQKKHPKKFPIKVSGQGAADLEDGPTDKPVLTLVTVSLESGSIMGMPTPVGTFGRLCNPNAWYCISIKGEGAWNYLLFVHRSAKYTVPETNTSGIGMGIIKRDYDRFLAGYVCE